MKKKNKIEDVLGVKMERKYGYFFINGKYFQIDQENGKTIFIEVKDISERLKMVNEIVPKLKSGLNAEAVLREALMNNFERKGLEKLYKTLFGSKKKYKPKTREGYCVDMKVGNIIIPIVD